jgi:recombinational DNA repair protein (RecF pathway)
MYAKYHTDALVLGHREHGEADRVYALYTREFGLVWARAGAVRKEASKMRGALQTCARADVSLVRGGASWRAAGAAASLTVLSGDPLRTFARIARLVLRLVAAEERSDYLFDVLASAHEALFGASRDALPTIELVSVARILYALGYLSAEALGDALFVDAAFGADRLAHAETARGPLLTSINRALSETQL